MSHLAKELPRAARADRADLADALAIDAELADRVVQNLVHAGKARGRESGPAVSRALADVSKLIGAHGVESIVDRDFWVSAYYGDSIAVFVNLGDNTLTTVLFDTTDDEFYLTSPEVWLAAYEQARYEDELEYTTVHLDSLGAEEDEVIAAIRHPRARDLAREHQSIAGSRWECVDTDYAYAILENHEHLVDELEAERYDLNLDEYEAP